MEINGLNIAAMILFNTAFCILLPRIVTLNWVEIFQSLSNSESKLFDSTTSNENITEA